MSEQRVRVAWAAAAMVWLMLVVAIGVHQWSFWQQGRLGTDVLALLPQDEQEPAVAIATRKLADRASRRITVMLGAPDWPAAQAAAAAWRAGLAAAGAPLKLQAAPAQDGAAALLDFYRPWRDRLLTNAQRELLMQARPADLLAGALANLHQPGASARPSQWLMDPIGLWPQWWAERAGESGVRPRDGELWVSGQGMQWIVLPYETTGPAISLAGEPVYADALRAAQEQALQAVPQVRVLATGVPLHAEAAAVQASKEVSSIGWGSLAAVLLLVWLAFRRLQPIALVALSLLVGTAAALTLTALVFDQVHLVTLVFGASLVGVAEDYGIHYFASRQGMPHARPRSLLRKLLPGLVLALVTSVLAYLVLGLAPFPGLRQMALFSATGLVAAFLTVVLWFPWLDRGTVPRSRFADAIASSLARWPRWPRWSRLPKWRNRPLVVGAGLAALLLCALGISQLRASDDIRLLQSSPAALVQAQQAAGKLMGLPGVAQFYLVSGDTAEQVLVREEALKSRLDMLVKGRVIGGYSAVSDWIPSAVRQQENALLSARAETTVLAGVNQALGEQLQRPAFAAQPLQLTEWLAHPASMPVRDLWLDRVDGQVTSVVVLRGLHDSSVLARLDAAADGLPGVRWVDKVAEVSALLGRYRVSMGTFLLVGHLAVLAVLLWRYGRPGWRAWLPTVLASVATVAVLGGIGEPFQLFNVLALVLLLGIGVDYGIFLLEHRGDGTAWLAVVLGACSTWLAFGLLALSATPALRAFGLTLLLGIALVWLLSPLLRAPDVEEEAA